MSETTRYPQTDIERSVSQTAPQLSARYDRANDYHHILPGKTASPNFHQKLLPKEAIPTSVRKQLPRYGNP